MRLKKLHLKSSAFVVLFGTCPALAPAQQYVISTFAGGAPPPLQTSASDANIGNPSAIAFDSSGNIYFVSLNCAFKLDSQGAVTRIAGTGAGAYSGDGGPATAAKLFSPGGIAVDNSGNVYIADSANARIRRVAPNGIITTIAGNGTPGFSSDGGAATAAQFRNPSGLALDAKGNLYVLDSSNIRLRRISASGIVTTVAGNGTSGYSGDGGPATSATMTPARGLAIDKSGNIYIADTANQRIRRIATDGTIATFAGNGTSGAADNGGPATQAQLNFPSDVAADTSGNIYISEAAGLRAVSSDGTVRTLAPQGTVTDPLAGINCLLADAAGDV